MQRLLMKSLAVGSSPTRVASPLHACFATTATQKPSNYAKMGRVAPEVVADTEFLQRLHEEYTARTVKSVEMHNQIKKTFAESSSWAQPVIVEKAEGARFTCIDGHSYIDLLSGFGSSLFGHNNRFFKKVIQQTIDGGDYHVGTRSPYLKEASERACKATGFDKCYFFESGTTACHVALRLARAHRQRDTIVLFTSCWHGQSDSTLHMSDGEGGTFPMSAGIPDALCQDIVMFKYGDPHAIEEIRENGDDIAAVMVEPVQLKDVRGRSKEFLQALRDAADEHGFILIFDEVITGFRIALGGGQEYFGIKADMGTYGKAMGGGVGIGMLAGKAEIMETIGKIAIGGTFCSNGMQLQAVAEVTKYLMENKDEFYSKMRANTMILADGVKEACTTMKIPLEVAMCESIIRLEFEPWFQQQHLHVILAFVLALRTNGIYYLTFGAFGFVTEAHTKEVMEEATKIIVDTLTEFHNADMFPERP